MTLWQVSQLLGFDDPQAAFGLPAGKQITLVAMSTNRDATSRDVFGDLVGMVRASDVFDGYVEHIGSDTIRFWTPAQLANGARQRCERGLIVLSALPTTASSARGPAAKRDDPLAAAVEAPDRGPCIAPSDAHDVERDC